MSPPLTTLTVHAGSHDRVQCPIRLTLPAPLPEGAWELRSTSGENVPLQRLEGNEAVCLERSLRAGQSRLYTLERREQPAPNHVSLEPTEGSYIAISLDGALLTRYNYGN